MSSSYQQALPNGTRLEEFEVTAVLGAGGFGVTYKGLDHRFQREVAIKEFLPGELAVRDPATGNVTPRSPEMSTDYQWGLNRFLEESRTLAKFDDPHIVKVHRYLESHGTAYLVMQYSDGESLSQVLNRRRDGMAEDEIRRFMVPVLLGLQTVHTRNYLHRDIKPSNIYLRYDGTPMLIDFGAARHALSEHSRTLMSMMTPGYAPFEQYSANAKQGPYTDLYAMGATLYRCISGKSPADAADRMTALTEGVVDPYVPASTLGDGRYSNRLLGAVDWMLQLRPADRPQSVRDALEFIGADTGVAPVPDEPVSRSARTVVLRNTAPKMPRLPKLSFQSRPPGWLGAAIVNGFRNAGGRIAAVPAVAAALEWRARASQRVQERVNYAGLRAANETTKLVQRYRASTRAQGIARVALLVAVFGAYGFAETRWVLAPGDRFHDRLRDGTRAPEMAVVPARGDAPPYGISTHEITFEEYDRFARETLRALPSDEGWGRGNRPVVNVSWRDAAAYSEWLSAQTGRPYRLPTEPEWERAARGGVDGMAFWWGRVVGTNRANCANCGSTWDGRLTAPAGSFEPNAYGLRDTAGNVAEWTCSAAAGTPEATCTGNGDPRRRIIRGGSWATRAEEVAVNARAEQRPDFAGSAVGFRVLAELPHKAIRQ